MIELRLMSAAFGEALLAGDDLPAVTVADYPTEFSRGMAPMVGTGSPLGPWLMLRIPDGAIVGDIGGAFTGPRQAEIGYAVTPSSRGRGYATAAVHLVVEEARRHPAIDVLIAHTPLDRPASAAVLRRNGFHFVGELDDEHEGATIRVHEWRLDVTGSAHRAPVTPPVG